MTDKRKDENGQVPSDKLAAFLGSFFGTLSARVQAEEVAHVLGFTHMKLHELKLEATLEVYKKFEKENERRGGVLSAEEVKILGDIKKTLTTALTIRDDLCALIKDVEGN